MVGYVVFALDRSASRIEEKQTTVATAETLAAVADPLAALCAQDPTVRARVGQACDTAAQAVAAAPTIAAAARDGRDGASGTDGIDGRGITSAAVVTGRLVLTYTDGSTTDLGPVVGQVGATGPIGATGAAGQPGMDGRGVSSAAVEECRLVLTYTTGEAVDVGQVCAPDREPRAPSGRRLPATG